MTITPQEIRQLSETHSVGASDSVVLFRDNKVVRTTVGDLGRFIRGSKGISEATGDYTVSRVDEIIEFSISVSATATLPIPTSNKGKLYSVINKYDSTANVNFSESLSNDGAFQLQPDESIDFYSNGTEYIVD
jgi:hypothetical protein